MVHCQYTRVSIIYSPDTFSAVLHTSCVPPPEVPQVRGLKGRGEGWTGPRGAKLTRVDSVMSRGNWQQVDSGGQTVSYGSRFIYIHKVHTVYITGNKYKLYKKQLQLLG